MSDEVIVAAAPGVELEKLSALEPAFKAGGKVTAGNSCPLSDGAAAVVVMSRDDRRADHVHPAQ